MMKIVLLIVASVAVANAGNCKQVRDAKLEELKKKPLFGAFIPQCDADGTYARVQYMGATTYCAAKDGQRIGDYTANRANRDVDCNCARDQYEYKQLGIVGKLFSCEQSGNYKSVQCSGSVCFCVDNKGLQLAGTDTVKIGETDRLNC
ncbi:equistatin-like [Tubulanus polymorphus]|uniref:equistatin-like n=1 Tax=Tubulanus polymorphus TaxID=672921 RepID=UPI003DA6AB4C